MMKLMIHEVLKKAHGAKTKAQKVKILQENNSQVLRTLFIINFDESVKTRIPEGEVPYKPNEAPQGTEHSLLEKEAKKLYYYVKGGADNLPQLRIETMYIQLLEALYKDEAEVLTHVFNRDLHKHYRITHAVVKEAFPEISWGGRS